MSKEQNPSEVQTIKLDLYKIYEICESYGVSKEVISSFRTLQRRLQHAKNSTRAKGKKRV
ncbi:hypothetical protein [Cytobacillus dafuensis]|uniref:hypothetical protein n=1 Tax=Cytobacillus dafuensis TaxID=1742359 RepID=UPI00070E9E84|nr:hypothetical protein [Cytobacillus dafuensis]